MSAAAASADPAEVQPAQQEWPSTPHADAERMVEKAQTRNMTVKFMVDKLKEVCNKTTLFQWCHRRISPVAAQDGSNDNILLPRVPRQLQLGCSAGRVWGGSRLLQG